jgi:hypothetical protein
MSRRSDGSSSGRSEDVRAKSRPDTPEQPAPAGEVDAQVLNPSGVEALITSKQSDDVAAGQPCQSDWDQGAEVCADELLKRLADELPVLEHQASVFLDRHRARWSRSLLIVEAFLQAAAELGREVNEAERPAAAARGDTRFEALIRNHARAIQVAREVYVLASNGYSSGALSRWRTLHEIAVTSLFLHQHESELSERYLLHDVVESRDSAREHNKYKERLRCEAPSTEELANLEDQVSSLERRFGAHFGRPNGWAQGYVFGISKNERVTFSAIERAVALDHWRPRYKLASQAVHSPSKAGYWSLSAGLMHDFLLIGPSGEGLAEVLDPLMLSTNVVNSCVALNWPNESRVLLLKALIVLRRRGSEALVREHARQQVVDSQSARETGPNMPSQDGHADVEEACAQEASAEGAPADCVQVELVSPRDADTEPTSQTRAALNGGDLPAPGIEQTKVPKDAPNSPVSGHTC